MYGQEDNGQSQPQATAQPAQQSAGGQHPYFQNQPPIPQPSQAPQGGYGQGQSGQGGYPNAQHPLGNGQPAVPPPNQGYVLPGQHPWVHPQGNQQDYQQDYRYTPQQAPYQAQQPVPQSAPELTPAGQAAQEQGPGGAEQYSHLFSDPVSQSLVQGIETLAASKGVDLEQAFGPAYESGNPEFINHAYLQSVAPELAGILAQQATALIQHEEARTQQTIGTVYQMAGGEQQWQSAAQAFNQNAPEQARAVIRQLLDSGDQNSLQYAVQTVLGYAHGNGSVPYQQGTVLNPAMTQNSAFNQTMTRENFLKAEKQLRDQYGIHSNEYRQQLDHLVNQRGRARGMGR